MTQDKTRCLDVLIAKEKFSGVHTAVSGTEVVRQGLQPLSKRNAETVEVALREMNTKLHEGLSVIIAQRNTIADLVARVNVLEQYMNAYRANLVGRGPTVK